jgi:hypothetical protein
MFVYQRLVIVFALCASATGYSQSAGNLSALRLSTSSTWSDNISHTSHLPTLKSGQYFSVSGAMDFAKQLDRNWLFVAEGELVGQQVRKFSALNNLAVNGTLKVRRKFGLGPLAPVVEFATGLSAFEFKENGRSGWQASANGRISKRFNAELSLVTGVGLKEYFGNHPVFDLSDRKAFIEGDWDLSDRWRLSAGFSRAWGEYLANAHPTIWPLAIGGGLGPEIYTHYNTLAWEVTNTYGPGWVAYRNRDTTTDTSWLELSPALTERTSLSLRYEKVRASNGIGIKYDATLWTFGLNHQF